MKQATHILIVEHAATDIELAEHEICKVIRNCDFQVVETRKDFLKALEIFQPDVILSDYVLPRFDGITALKLVRKQSPLIPFIIWTGSSSEDVAVECMKAGANNYVLKENIKRLGPAVIHALEERELLLAHQQAEEKYQTIFENSVVGIFQSTPQGRYRTVNPAMAYLYGYDSPKEMIKAVKDIKQQIYVDVDRRSEFISLLESQDTIEHYEERNYRKDRSIIWTSTSARVVRDSNGNILYYEGFITDITARKEIEEKLKERERQLSILFGNLPGPVYRCRYDANYTMDFISAGIRELSGYPAEDFQRHRRDFGKLIHPEDQEQVWAGIQAAVQQSQPFELTYRIVTATGEEKWVWEKGQGVYDAQGQLQALEGFITDITARKRAEEAIHNSEKRFRALIENGLDNISLLAADGTLLWESPATTRMLNYVPDEFVGQNIFELMHPDDFEWTRDLYVKLVQEPGSRQSGIFRLRHSSGTWRWVEAIVTNMLDDPSVGAIVVNYRDVTERKQVEETLREERNLLRTLIDNLPDRIYAMDIQGRKTLSNTADWQACGGKTMEDIIGKTDFDTYPPDLAEEFWQLDKVVLGSGQAVINYEEPGLDAEGNRVSILTTKIPLRNSEGKVTGLVGIGRDITERKQVEERINDLLAFNEKMLNHSAVGILTYKVSGPCEFANENAASMVGTSVTQLMAQNFRSIESWKRSGLYDLVEKAIATLSPATADIHHVSTFGKEAWMTVHCITFKAKGEDHVLLSISDITERKQAEEKLRQSENRYRLAIKATNDVIWETNLQAKQLYWSENAQIVFGYTPQEVDSYETWWDDHLHPDDRERVLSKINGLIEGNESLWMDEYRFQLKDGYYAYISDRGYIERDANGTALRMIGAMTDSTERKRAEDKLRESENRLFMALSGAQMSVWEWDLKTNQIFWSPEFFQITGVNENQFGGTFESFADLIHNDDVDRVRSAAEKAMREQTLFAEEFRIICPDGEVRWLSNLGQAEYDSTGSHLRLIGTVQDVTPRKQAEIERQALLEIMQGLANTADLHELLKLIHHSIARVVYAKNFFVVLYKPNTGLFEEIYSVDQYDPPAPPSKLENTITSFVFRSGEPLLLTRVLFDELVKQGEMNMIGTEPASWLGVPLKTSGKTIGVMAVQDYAYDNRYTERDKHFMASLAAQVALVIERKQAEEALRESEEHYRAIFEGVQDAIFVESLDGRILMVNDRACEMFGYRREKFLTKTVRDLVPEGNLILMANEENSLLSAEPHETLNQRANGEIFPIDISGRLQVINGETVLLVVVRDITERKKAQELLQESENRFSSAFEYASIGMALISPEGRWLRVNWALCELVGYSEEELSQKTFQDITYTDDLDKDIAYVQKVLAGEIDSYQMEKRYVHKSGKIIWVLLSASLVRDNEGKPLYFISQMQDITERKKAETALVESNAKFRGLFEASPDAILLIDPNNEWPILDCNTAACQLNGYSREELIGQSIDLLNLTAGQPNERTHYLERIREAGVLRLETVHRRKDGVIIPVEVSTSLITLGGRDVILGIDRDVTERKRMEIAEHEQRALAEALRDTAETLNSTLDYGEVLDHILTTVGRVVPHDAATIMLIEGEFARVVRSQGYNQQGFSAELIGTRLPLEETSNLRQMLTTGQPEVVSDTWTYAGWKSLSYTDWLRSNVGVPISIYGQVIGFILVDSGTPGFFTAVHAERLEAFANQAALAIHNAQLLRQAQEEIAERKRAEEELRFEKERIEKIATAVPGMIGSLRLRPDGSGCMPFASPAIQDVYGFSPADLEEDIAPFFARVHPEDLPHLNASIQESAQTLLPWHGEFRYHHPIKGEVWIEGRSMPLLEEDDSIIWHGFLYDITERKRAEAELRASEERFRQLADNIQEVFWMTDARNGQEIYMSPAAEAIWGQSLKTLMDEPNAFIQSVFPEDRSHVLQSIEKEKNGEKVEMQYRIVRPDGSIRWIWDRAFPIFDDSGKVKRIAGISADITERRESELALVKSQSRYRELFDSSPVSIWEEDFSLVKKQINDLIKNGVTDLKEYFSSHPNEVIELASLVMITDVNQASMDLYQVEQKEDLLKSLTQALGQETVGHFQDEISGLLSPHQRFVWEGTENKPDGSQAELVVTGSIPHGYEEDWSKVIVSIIDITERKQAEQSLRESEARYHGLFQNLVDAFALHDIVTDDQGKPLDYIFLEVNPAFERMTGLDAAQIIGRRVTEVLPGVENERFIPVYGQVALTGKPVHFEEYSVSLGMYFEINAYSPKHGQFAVTFVDVTERKQAEDEIRRRAEENSILLRTSLALTNLDLKATLQTVGDSAKNLFAADGCRIFLMEPDGKFLRCVLALQENLDAFSDLRIKIGEGVTGAVAASGQAEIVNEMQNDPRSMQVVGTPEEEEAIMFAPLKERDNTVGVLSIRRIGGDRPFQSADLELLEALASMAASAVSNARLFAETQRRLTELEALYENGLAVGRLLKPGEIGNRIINTFARYLPWHHVTIRLRQGTSDNLELVAFNLPNLREEERTHAEQHFIARINKVEQGLSGWVIQTGIPLRTGNVHAHPQYIDTHAGIQSGLYMPLKVGERVMGVISVESEVPDAFTEQDERLLATLGSQAAIAFENARLYQAIEQELSERKRAEEALRTSETHYRELADSITDILFELDQHLRFTHWNKASEMLTSISAKDAIGKSMYEIFGESEEQIEISQIYADVLQNHRSRTFESTILLHGEKRSFDINAYPSTRGVSVVAKDVTDRKRSEIIMQKRFELMEYSAHHPLDELMQRTVDEVSELTGSLIGFFHFVQEDQNTLGMQTWSTNALKLFNVPIREGTHLALDQAGVWADAVHQRCPLIQNDYEVLTDKKGLPQRYVPITREIIIPIIRNERVMAIIGIGNKLQEYTSYDLEVAERLADYAWDITERKQMQVALEVERNQLAKRVEERTSDLSQANSNLARALRVKDEFLANMSHELRTPLNAILGLSESLGEQIAGPLNEKQQKYITTISESGHHLLSLINDILDLAKIEAGQITLDINKVDIHQVCQASLRMIKQLAQKKNQEVVLEMGNGLGLMWADERRLKQMIVNLLGNAVKFTPEYGKIGLDVHGDQAANKVTITVWDNGIGIKDDDLARLFQPFVQLDSGLAREATGTGLGLALVAQMARLHGGSVSAVSEAGKGSRFSIILPWEPVLAIDTGSRLRTTGKFRAIKPDETNKPTILLVEDTKEVVMMIRDYLELAGYRVVIARDGVEAIAQARIVHPDLILMDVMMPRMDGFEATRKLRSEPEFKYTPIIALTALAMPSDRERCLAAGMDEYISKPVNLKALIRIIQSCLFNSKEPKSG